MITGKVQELEAYAALHPRFPAAIAFAKELLAGTPANGHHYLAGAEKEIFANVISTNTRLMEKGVMEVHEKYVDIQIIVNGQEKMFVPGLEVGENTLPYDPNGDCALYAMPNPDTCSSATLQAGEFAIFLPNEQHCPSMAIGEESKPVNKIVVKVLF